jgi:hypothetical protein
MGDATLACPGLAVEGRGGLLFHSWTLGLIARKGDWADLLPVGDGARAVWRGHSGVVAEGERDGEAGGVSARVEVSHGSDNIHRSRGASVGPSVVVAAAWRLVAEQSIPAVASATSSSPWSINDSTYMDTRLYPSTSRVTQSARNRVISSRGQSNMVWSVWASRRSWEHAALREIAVDHVARRIWPSFDRRA